MVYSGLIQDDGTPYNVDNSDEIQNALLHKKLIPSPKQPDLVADKILNEYQQNDTCTLRRWNGDWIEWCGTHWKTKDTERLKVKIYDYAKDKYYLAGKDGTPKRWDANASRVTNVMDAMVHSNRAQMREEQEAQQWIDENRSNHYISCANGLLNIETRELISHNPNFLTFTSVPYEYDPSAPTPQKWLDFLHQLWGDKPENITILQEFFGYFLSGQNNQEKILYIFGPRRSGKGTITEVLTALIGEKNTAAPTLQSLSGSFGLSGLVGKSLATLTDVRWSSKYSVGLERILAISGRDPIEINEKYKKPQTYKLSTRFLMLSNDLPTVDDESAALIGRLVPLQTTVSFFGREDPTLKQRLKLPKELAGIFNWALEGLKRLNEQGRFTESIRTEQIRQEMEEQSSEIKPFIEETNRNFEYRFSPEDWISKPDLYQDYLLWVESLNNKSKPLELRTFFKRFISAYPALETKKITVNGRRVNVYIGIGKYYL